MNLNGKFRFSHELLWVLSLEKRYIEKSCGTVIICTLLLLFTPNRLFGDIANQASHEQVLATMRKAAAFFRTKVTSHGGYVYYYSPDLKQRWGEGVATPD